MFPLLARERTRSCELRRAVRRPRAPAAESAPTLARTAVDPRVNAEKRDLTTRQGDSVGCRSLRASAGPAPDLGERVRVCYHIQSHTLPAQLARLIRTIRISSPTSLIVVSHAETGPEIDLGELASDPAVIVLPVPNGYGDFSHVDRWLEAVDLLAARGERLRLALQHDRAGLPAGLARGGRARAGRGRRRRLSCSTSRSSPARAVAAQQGRHPLLLRLRPAADRRPGRNG